MRKKAVKLIGEQNVERLEAVYSFIETLVVEGWGGVWSRIMDSVATVRDLVFDAIKSFLLEKIVIAAITKIASLFSPVGAIIQLILTAWNIYTFLRDQLARIVQVVQSVVEAIGDIARGVLEGAIVRVESVIGNLLPIAIDFLARLIGLGNVGARVKEIVEQIRAMVDKAIDALIQRVVGLFKGGKGTTADAAKPAPGATTGAPTVEPEAPEGNTVTETFEVPGEEHTLRAVIDAGETEVEMASNGYGDLEKKVRDLTSTLAARYLNPEHADYVGETKAKELKDVEFPALRARAGTLIKDLAAIPPAPPGADENAVRKVAAIKRKVVAEGFNELRLKVESFGLSRSATDAPLSTLLHGGHGPQPSGVASYGRVKGFRVSPMSVESLDKGGSARDPVPGMKVIPGYQRGHLVAKSLGGPGTPDNLVPMSRSVNVERIGMQGIEDDLRYALRTSRDNPRDYSPGYVFDFQVETPYYEPPDLQDELDDEGVALPTSGADLFSLAQSAATREPKDDELLKLVATPVPTGAKGKPLSKTALKKLLSSISRISREVTRERERAQDSLNRLAGGKIKHATTTEAAKAQVGEILSLPGVTPEQRVTARDQIDRLVDPTVSEVHARVVEILAELKLEITSAEVDVAEANVEAARVALANAQTAAAAAQADPLAQSTLQTATVQLQQAEAALAAAETAMETAEKETELAGLGADRSKLASNVRRRLAFYFHPIEITATRKLIEEPDLNKLDLRRTDQPLPTHLGLNLEWKD
jgi:hypothetical protein